MWVKIVAGFLSALAFATLYNVPKKQVPAAGIVGGIGWFLFLVTSFLLGEVAGMFIAATIVAILSEVLARTRKEPVVIFLIPGVIPLVPGGKAYLTMLSFLQNEYLEGLELLVSTIFLAGAVAAGIILISSIFRVFARTKSMRRR